MKSLKFLNSGKQITTNRDFFGIADITSKDIAGAFKSVTKLSRDALDAKYKALQIKRDELQNKVNEKNAVFGVFRFDHDNIPKIHGQFEKNNEDRLYDTIDIKQIFMPDTDESSESINRQKRLDSAKEQPEIQDHIIDTSKIEGYRPPYRISEVVPTWNISEALTIFKEDLEESAKNINQYSNIPPLTFFFRGSKSEFNNLNSSRIVEEATNSHAEKLSGRKLSDLELEESISEASNQISLKPTLEYDADKDKIPFDETDPGDYADREVENMKRMAWDESIDEEFDEVKSINKKPKTNAFEYLQSIRTHRIEPQSEKLRQRYREFNDNPDNFTRSIKLDSHGFRDYRDQVPDWSKFRDVELINYLENSIIYFNYDILAINKPYGLACHREEYLPGTKDINTLMQEIGSRRRIEKLYLAHRLDKTTTGVLLFATSESMAQRLNKLFKSGDISKTYLCITKGVPQLQRGIIDIPIGELKMCGKVRSCLCPEKVERMKQFSRRYQEARRAVTEYKVLQTNNKTSLIEVKPRTGVKHQIRCHLGFGLGTPILGDHKYSKLEKLAPQQLSVPVLKALQLRQSKTRTLPMHLHAKSIVIPGAKANGETLFLKAPLPHHFIENMKSLQFNTSRN